MTNKVIRLGLPLMLLAIGFAAYADRAETLTEALGIEKLSSATVIHSPRGFSNPRERTTAFITDQQTLAAMHKLLGKFSARGGVFKQWPEDIGHRRIYLHANDKKVISLDIYGHSLQSPLDATFSALRGDPQNTELVKLVERIDQIGQSQRFRSRRGPVGKTPESDWRPTDRRRDTFIAAVKALDSKVLTVGEPDNWQWKDAELYIDGRGHCLLWVFYKSQNRGRIWRWVELDGEAKGIKFSGWGEG
jgi:hypothetical protein